MVILFSLEVVQACGPIFLSDFYSCFPPYLGWGLRPVRLRASLGCSTLAQAEASLPDPAAQNSAGMHRSL